MDGEVLREILREEPGMFPSHADEDVAKQAIADSQVAVPCGVRARRTLFTVLVFRRAGGSRRSGEGEGAGDPGEDGAEPAAARPAPRVAPARERANRVQDGQER